MSKSGNIKDMVRAARPGTVILMTVQDFREIVEEAAKLLQSSQVIKPAVIEVTSSYIQNVEQSELIKQEAINGGE